MSRLTKIDTSADLGVIVMTGYADQAFIAELYSITPLGTVASADDITDKGRVHTPINLSLYASFDCEFRPTWDSVQTVVATATNTIASPYNELTISVSDEQSGVMQGWPTARGIVTIMGVLATGERAPLGQGRWRIGRPSAART